MVGKVVLCDFFVRVPVGVEPVVHEAEEEEKGAGVEEGVAFEDGELRVEGIG